jgi:hypothetical protein
MRAGLHSNAHEGIRLQSGCQAEIDCAVARAMGRETDNDAALTLTQLAGGAADVIALSGRADDYFSAGRRYSVLCLS